MWRYDNGYGFTLDSKCLCSESARPIKSKLYLILNVYVYIFLINSTYTFISEFITAVRCARTMNNSLVYSNFVMEIKMDSTILNNYANEYNIIQRRGLHFY